MEQLTTHVSAHGVGEGLAGYADQRARDVAWMPATGRNQMLLALDVIEAAKRVLAWIGEDRYTQLEKVDGGNELDRTVRAFESADNEMDTTGDPPAVGEPGPWESESIHLATHMALWRQGNQEAP